MAVLLIHESGDVRLEITADGGISADPESILVSYPKGTVIILLVLVSIALQGADWSRFRGPNGEGVADGKPLPVTFSSTDKVGWMTEVPFGQSSPIVVGNRVFLTAAEGKSLLTIAYDAATGRELWRKEAPRARTQPIYKANDPASSTPAADDKALYVFFPDFGLISYSFDGKERWRLPLGPFDNFYGLSTSPVIAGNQLILLCDQVRGSFLLSLDKDTGKQRWKTERRDRMEGWSVPIIYDDQIVTFGSTHLDSYYLGTGEARWWMPISANGAIGTPVIHNGRLLVSYLGMDKPWLPSFASTIEKLDKNRDGKLSQEESKADQEWSEHFGWIDRDHDGLIQAAEWDDARQLGVGEFGAISLRLEGKGRLDPSKAVAWRFQRNVPYIPTPILYKGIYYMVKSGGIVTALDPATGKLLKQGRSERALGEYYASPVAGDGKLYIVSNEGKVSVLQAGADWQVVSVNDLGEDVFATPAISNGCLFVRTRGRLYCFNGPK